MRFRVAIRLRPGILDVQGAAVRRALIGLGFTELADLRVGKLIELEVAEVSAERAHARVDDMCRRLLASPVLEDYTIEAVGSEEEEATRGGGSRSPRAPG